MIEINTFDEFKRACIRGAWRGLKYQGFKQAKDEDEIGGTCLWRDKNGNRCAVGWLIPEENLTLYDGEVSGDSDSALDRGMLAQPLMDFWNLRHVPNEYDDDVRTFLETLQECHDIGDTPKAMEQNLKLFAMAHNVELPKD